MRILVPLDGSSIAEGAVESAVKLLRQSSPSYELVLVRVVRYPVAIAEYDDKPESPLHLVDAARDACQDYLRALARHPDVSDIIVHTKVLIGEPAEQIHAYAQTIHADLLVLTKQGRHGAEHLGMGEVALAIAQQAHLPTLLLTTTPPSLPPPASACVVLVLTEDLPLTNAQLQTMGTIVPLLAKELDVVRVLPPAETKASLTIVETQLAGLVAQFTSLGIIAQARLVIGDNVTKALPAPSPQQIIMLSLAPDIPHHALAEAMMQEPFPLLIWPCLLAEDT